VYVVLEGQCDGKRLLGYIDVYVMVNWLDSSGSG
jgi:hypothetical protein